ncbi:MAG: peptidylprolyl isomerase, partial [bacterium]
SSPVRSEYGYHLIKATKKQPAVGKVTVAHLFKVIPKGATAEDSLKVHQKIDSIYTLLQNGARWDSVVKIFSDDKGSAARGGTLPKLGVNRWVPEFVDAIYQLREVGNYTKPILTPYGWHIIRLEERETQATFDQVKVDLKQKVIKDGRSQIGREVVLQEIIREYGLKQYIEAKQAFYTVVTDSIFFGKWDVNLAKGLTKPLFKIGDQVTTQQDFANYLASKQKKREKENIQAYVNNRYKDFLNEKLMRVEDKHLEAKYPEFQALMNEYRDGILLFDLTDKNVWSKAVKDTTGLKEFYEKNKGEYMWGPRVDASIYIAKDPTILVKVRNFISTGLTDENILKEINIDTNKILTIESGKFLRTSNPYVEKIKWETGLSQDINTDNGTGFVNIHKVLKPEPKQLNEARGLITADYQNYLEKDWIKELKRKYPVVVHKEMFIKIK